MTKQRDKKANLEKSDFREKLIDCIAGEFAKEVDNSVLHIEHEANNKSIKALNDLNSVYSFRYVKEHYRLVEAHRKHQSDKQKYAEMMPCYCMKQMDENYVALSIAKGTNNKAIKSLDDRNRYMSMVIDFRITYEQLLLKKTNGLSQSEIEYTEMVLCNYTYMYYLRLPTINRKKERKHKDRDNDEYKHDGNEVEISLDELFSVYFFLIIRKILEKSFSKRRKQRKILFCLLLLFASFAERF
jgi:hypothetical protein